MSCFFCALAASETGLVAWWKFDEGKGKVAIDRITQRKDTILCNFRYLPGVPESVVKFDGKNISRGKDFRFGHRHRLEGSDLIVWVKKKTTKPIKILPLPVE